jgi:hypothetical protein
MMITKSMYYVALLLDLFNCINYILSTHYITLHYITSTKVNSYKILLNQKPLNYVHSWFQVNPKYLNTKNIQKLFYLPNLSDIFLPILDLLSLVKVRSGSDWLWLWLTLIDWSYRQKKASYRSALWWMLALRLFYSKCRPSVLFFFNHSHT